MSDVEVKAELDLSPASKELLEWARNNIREDPDRKWLMVDELRDLIYSKGECIPHRVDDAFLLRFLRSRKFRLEASYNLIVNYYEFREGLVKGVGLELLEKIGEHDVISVPPYLDQTGKRILLYKLGNWIPEVFSPDDLFSASLLILELAILEDRAQIYGGICIVDCGGLTMQQALHMTPSVAHKIMQLAVTSQPMRLEAMHIVNNSWLMETMFHVMKPLLHDKMKERLFFHGEDMGSLHKYVDPKCLAQIYGGVHPCYDYNDWLNGFRKNKTIMKELKLQGYDV